MVIARWSSWFFGSEFRSALGRMTLFAAIAFFVVHLLLFALKPWIPELTSSPLFASPINAIYTPFSILLVFEVYLLVYYLRRSTTIYIGKQYEIMALILIRGIFKDMTHLDLTQAGFLKGANWDLALDLFTVVAVYALIFMFYRISGYFQSKDRLEADQPLESGALRRFVRAKNALALILLVFLTALSMYSLADWWAGDEVGASSVLDLNAIFFDQFYTVLIMSDVLILLLSLLYSDDFPTIIRNSSFVVSTILLKFSFAAESGISQVLILIGVAFGVLMLALSNAFYRINYVKNP
jgi:hypothetical protein